MIPSRGRIFLRPGAIAALVFVFALLVRLAYLAAFRHSPFYSQLIVDAQWHDEWAWNWARGLPGTDPGAFFRAPLYPLWLSFLYRVFGHDLDAVRVVQALFGAGTAAFLGLAGTRWFGKGAGLTAGLLAALYGPFIHYDAELLIPNLLLILLAGALAVLASGKGRLAALRAGFLVGLAGIARPNALVLLPAVVLFLAHRERPAIPASVGLPGLGRRFLPAFLALAAGLLPALAVTAINSHRESSWVGVASQGGLNFYAGNHPGATGRSMEIPELRDLVSWRELVPAAEHTAEQAAGRDLDSGGVSGWWFRRGLAWLGEHPGDALELYARKLYYLANSYEIPSDRDLYVHARGILRALLWSVPGLGVPWGLVFPLAAVGFAAFRNRSGLRAPVRFLGAWVALYAASLLPFFVTGRFRLGLVPPVLLLAALALSRPREAFRGRSLLVGIVVFLIANSAFFGARTVNRAAEEARLGDVFLRAGDAEAGLAALERSYGLDSTRTVTAYLLARGNLESGRPREAVRYFERVFFARPEDPSVNFELGVALLEAGEFRRASWALERTVTLDAKNAPAWVNLGVAYEEQGLTDRALAAYRRATDLAPGAETGLVRYAGLLLKQDRAPETIRLLEDATARLPRSFDLRFSLAVARAAAKDSVRARDEANLALGLRPGDLRAQSLLRALAPVTR